MSSMNNDLAGKNLAGADFRKAFLTGVNLAGKNLSGTDFRGAVMSGANLTGANLSGADLRNAVLNSANLTGANLSGADLRDALLTGSNLSGANLSGADLRDVSLKTANTLGANFQGARGMENDAPSGTSHKFSASGLGSPSGTRHKFSSNGSTGIRILGNNSVNVNVGGGTMNNVSMSWGHTNFNVGKQLGGSVMCGSGQPPNLTNPAPGTVTHQDGWAVVATLGGSTLFIGPDASITINGASAAPEDLVNGGMNVVIRFPGSTMTFGEIS